MIMPVNPFHSTPQCFNTFNGYRTPQQHQIVAAIRHDCQPIKAEQIASHKIRACEAPPGWYNYYARHIR